MNQIYTEIILYNVSLHNFITHKSIAHCFKKTHKICRTSSYLQNYRCTQLSANELDGTILRGPFDHERLKPKNIRTSQGNVQHLVQLKQIMNAGLKI